MNIRLMEAFYRTAMERPDKIALITERSQMSYKDLLSLTQVLDIQLKTRGVREGQTIVVDTNRGELCLAFALLLSLRSLNVVFSSPGLVERHNVPFDKVITMAPIEDIAPDKQIVIEAEWFAMMGTIPLPVYQNLPGDGGSFITRTSGTTGLPKLVKIPEADRVRDMMAMTTISPEDMASVRFMTTAGPNTGWAMNKNLPVLLGGGSVISLGDDTTKMLAYADLWRVSHLLVTPSVLQQAIVIPDAGQFLTSVERIEIGGAFAPTGLLKRMSEMCSAELITLYGATEIGALSGRAYSSDADQQDGYLGEVFRDDLELVLLDDTLSEVHGASEGVLAIRLPKGSQRSYLQSDDQAEGIGLVDDLFVTGDIVRREERALYLIGRRKRILNLNGNKYPLDQIQAVLARDLPQGTEVAAVATQDAGGMEMLVVFYSGGSDITAADVETLLRKFWAKISLGAAHHVPRMPLTQSGKIDLAALRELTV